MLGGSTALQPVAHGACIGDLSGVMMQKLPPVIRGRYSPGPAISRIADWSTRISLMARCLLRSRTSGSGVSFRRSRTLAYTRSSQASTRPLPLTSISPRDSKTNSSLSVS